MTPLVLILLACGGSTPQTEAPAPQAPTAAAPTAPTGPTGPLTLSDPHAIQGLADADAADGTVDNQVARCPSCSLGMAGDPAHATHIGDVTLHSCSESCQSALEADPDGMLARLEGIGGE